MLSRFSMQPAPHLRFRSGVSYPDMFSIRLTNGIQADLIGFLECFYLKI